MATLLAGAGIAAALAGCTTAGTTTSQLTATGTTLDIYLSEPVSPTPAQQDVIDAEELAFHQLKGEVRDFGLRLIAVRRAKVSDSARVAIQDKSAIAYLGELAPGDTEQTAGITNALDLLTVSPTDNALELTQKTAAVPNAPAKYYEALSTYGHTFARVVPSAAQEASFAVALVRSLGARTLYTSNDGSDYGKAIAAALRADASGASLTASASESGAGAIFYGAASPAAAVRFFNAAAAANTTAALIGSSSLDTPAFDAGLTADARARMRVTTPGFVPRALTSAGAAFRSTFTTDYGHAPSTEAIFGYEAMADVLDAIAKPGTAANNRAKVIRAFMRLKDPAHSVLPPYSIDASGNTSLQAFVYLRPGGAPRALAGTARSAGG